MSLAGLRGFVNRVLLAKSLTWFYDRNHQKKLSLGDRGEIQAERFLLRLGWIILARSYATDLGEIDLIAVDQEIIIFVEVKTRTDSSKGLPVDAVDREKERRIARIADQYIRRHQLENCSVRFDVISILWDQNSEPKIKHYVDAFQAPATFGN